MKWVEIPNQIEELPAGSYCLWCKSWRPQTDTFEYVAVMNCTFSNSSHKWFVGGKKFTESCPDLRPTHYCKIVGPDDTTPVGVIVRPTSA